MWKCRFFRFFWKVYITRETVRQVPQSHMNQEITQVQYLVVLTGIVHPALEFCHLGLSVVLHHTNIRGSEKWNTKKVQGFM